MQVQKKKPAKGIYTLYAQTLAGFISGFTVTPLNVVVDKSVIKYAAPSNTSKLWTLAGQELKFMVTHPFKFVGSFEFGWMYFVYALTYTSSNLADHVNVTEQVSQPIQKLAIVFLTNTICSLIKDKKYAVRFGGQVKKFPITSLGLLFLRDLIAMASAFTLPPIIGKFIEKPLNLNEDNAIRVAQISSPLLVQLVATPIHLLALDLYNRPGKTLIQRYAYIKSIFTNTLMIRMMRFLPAYGLGGIANIQLRKWLKSQIPEEQ